MHPYGSCFHWLRRRGFSSGASVLRGWRPIPARSIATYTYDGITLLSLDATRSDETTYAVAYLYDEDGRPYAGVYASSEMTTPVTFLIATTDRGDVVALTNTAGAVFARYTYDPYGAVLSQDTNAVTGI
ncbi:MAG: hypothetical protein IBX63_11545, partial [Coriobacteriia bacterium]|nr:hypothetical protein [Coriobacteriia bacterium]